MPLYSIKLFIIHVPLAQNGHLNRLASACFFFVCTGAFFARLPIVAPPPYNRNSGNDVPHTQRNREGGVKIEFIEEMNNLTTCRSLQRTFSSQWNSQHQLFVARLFSSEESTLSSPTPTSTPSPMSTPSPASSSSTTESDSRLHSTE